MVRTSAWKNGRGEENNGRGEKKNGRGRRPDENRRVIAPAADTGSAPP
jgi:hypothetical protein